ncbi:UNVERIFIED_CONTAM: RNA polymerase sigma factor [Acetivibrio alkalicellulosi]
MINFKFFKKTRNDKDPNHEIIIRIKQGDYKLKNKLIDDYKPFIIKCVYQSTGKYVEVENSEELSIGLLAFNEAIDCFDENRDRKFLSFAAQVIRRRLINYKLRNKKNNLVYTFTCLENNNINIDENFTDNSDLNLLTKFEVRDEIEDFKRKLSEFGITLYDLVKKSPKHKDAISSCIRIARCIAENEILYSSLMRKKVLPMAELIKRVDVSQRTIERNRKFIIAACIVINSDLDIVKSYLKNAEKDGK